MVFHLPSRAFRPIDERQYSGLRTPRVFADYDSTNRPGTNIDLFEASLRNSFPEQRQLVKFLTKFYECNLGHNLPMKIPKLLVCGAQDSGKTTWAEVFYGRLLFSGVFIFTSYHLGVGA